MTSLLLGFRRKHLVQPYFVYESLTKEEELPSLYLQKKHTIDSLLRAIEKNLQKGLKAFLLFCVPSEKQNVPSLFTFEEKVKQNKSSIT
jgi:delta-aminolevulinic acid dehydratase/porphobilinogen synthase